MRDEEPSRIDTAYRSVADQRRRYVLAYLCDSSAETATLDDLAADVVEQETNSLAPDRESVKIDLYHVHLPLLADAGVIDFDNRTETVRYRNRSSIETVRDDGCPFTPTAGKSRGSTVRENNDGSLTRTVARCDTCGTFHVAKVSPDGSFCLDGLAECPCEDPDLMLLDTPT